MRDADNLLDSMTVSRVKAKTFHRMMSVGVTRPGLFSCVDENGERSEYVVKYHRKLGDGILCECMASLLGSYFGLSTPAIAAVEVDSHLVSVIPCRETQDLLTGDSGPHFGSKHLSGGFGILPNNPRIPQAVIQQAFDIFAFDMLIQNPDRCYKMAYGKPNHLYNGEDRLVIIDHEKAFSFLLPTVDSKPEPWKIEDLYFYRYHVFYIRLKMYTTREEEVLFEGFLDRLGALSDGVLKKIVEAVPAEWQNQSISDTILEHLCDVRDHIDLFERGLLEVLA